MPGVERGGPRAKFCRKRLVSPSKCAPGSFRVKTIKKDVKMVVCCPKGYYNRKARRCKIGTIAQNIMKRKTQAGTCPRM